MRFSPDLKSGAIKAGGIFAAASLVGALAYSASQDPEEVSKQDRVAVHNIAPQTLVMSTNPEFYDYEHRTGAIGLGQTAIARCTLYAGQGSKGMELFVEYNGAEGYIDVYTAGTKSSPGGKIQVSPDAESLREQLADCTELPK